MTTALHPHCCHRRWSALGIFVVVALWFVSISSSSHAFVVAPTARGRGWDPSLATTTFTTIMMAAGKGSSSSDLTNHGSSSKNENATTTSTTPTATAGDPLRAATGIRPSLHPITINAIAEALRKRATKASKLDQNKNNNNDDDDDMVFTASDKVPPIQVALTAGKIASAAIAKRKHDNDDQQQQLTTKEEQTVAGRILGVIMRFEDLEATLLERVSSVEWVAQYDEWGAFGVLPPSGPAPGGDEDDVGNKANLDRRILDDPLFCLNRAECLLAIFLESVEIPQLQLVGDVAAAAVVPDGSKIDFIDTDRLQVLRQKYASS